MDRAVRLLWKFSLQAAVRLSLGGLLLWLQQMSLCSLRHRLLITAEVEYHLYKEIHHTPDTAQRLVR